MKGFILGTVFGLVLATVGFSGIAKMLDKGVDTVILHYNIGVKALFY